MADHQVLLQGGNWKKQLLICLLVIAIALLILHLWRPGTIGDFLAYLYKALGNLYNDVGDIIGYLREKY